MRGLDGIGNLVLVIMAAASLISMIAAFSLDRIVNGLYSYGLHFSYGWSISYWNTIGTVFAMAWLNISVAIAFQIYRVRTIRKNEARNGDK